MIRSRVVLPDPLRPKITTTCLIYRGEDPRPYEVVSLNDVEDRHAWLEVRVQRKAAAQ